MKQFENEFTKYDNISILRGRNNLVAVKQVDRLSFIKTFKVEDEKYYKNCVTPSYLKYKTEESFFDSINHYGGKDREHQDDVRETVETYFEIVERIKNNLIKLKLSEESEEELKTFMKIAKSSVYVKIKDTILVRFGNSKGFYGQIEIDLEESLGFVFEGMYKAEELKYIINKVEGDLFIVYNALSHIKDIEENAFICRVSDQNCLNLVQSSNELGYELKKDNIF